MLAPPLEDSAPEAAPRDDHERADATPSFSGELARIGAAVAGVLVLLNEVTELKRQGILSLAASAAGPPEATASDVAAKLADAAARMDDLSQATSDDHATAPHGVIAMLEQSVAHSIALAIQNTVAVDQQLDVLAQALLARAAVAALQK